MNLSTFYGFRNHLNIVEIGFVGRLFQNYLFIQKSRFLRIFSLILLHFFWGHTVFTIYVIGRSTEIHTTKIHVRRRPTDSHYFYWFLMIRWIWILNTTGLLPTGSADGWRPRTIWIDSKQNKNVSDYLTINTRPNPRGPPVENSRGLEYFYLRPVGTSAVPAHVNRCAARSLFTPSPHDHTGASRRWILDVNAAGPTPQSYFFRPNKQPNTDGRVGPIVRFDFVPPAGRVVYSVIEMHAYFSLCFHLFPRQSPRALSFGRDFLTTARNKSSSSAAAAGARLSPVHAQSLHETPWSARELWAIRSDYARARAGGYDGPYGRQPGIPNDWNTMFEIAVVCKP